MPSYGSTGSATNSYTLNSVDDMMNALPDNFTNQIHASDVRNVVLTLYEDILGLSGSMGDSFTGSASSVYYNNPNPTTITVGGIDYNTIIGSQSLDQLITSILYPYIQPTITMTISPSVIEFGQTGQAITATITTIKRSNSITSALFYKPIGGFSSFSPYSNVMGVTVSAFQSTTSYLVNINNTFTASVADSIGIYKATSTLTFQSKRYWGSVPSFGPLSSSDILNPSLFQGELSTTRIQIKSGNEYVSFAWPSSFGTPSFSVGGINTNAWTQVNSGYIFTNTYGYTASYDVWMSNTYQNSTITVQIA